MRLEPAPPGEGDPFKDLSPMDKIMRRVAIVAAFVGVFVWFIKVVFG